MICCWNKIVYCGNKIPFLWEQNNKLLEQDIILREQNMFFFSHGLNQPLQISEYSSKRFFILLERSYTEEWKIPKCH
jgi:hypothetical protein